jgi:hypothetical protein
MLGLQLRDEFLGAHMPGTAISLRTSDNKGAAQKSADSILSITYPTADIQTALKAISVKNSGRPIVLMGGRGRGKSHIMAVMHHALHSPQVVESWLKEWGAKLGSDESGKLELLKGYFPISEPVQNQEYPFLWDLLFDRHPKGEYYRGHFESMPQSFPPRTLLEKMFEDQPIALILDEFQTWYTGLPDKDPKTGLLPKQYAFNFVQILSEIAAERPELLILVISVLNNDHDAFKQVHRQSPVIIDFRGPSARQDRQKLLLHRLFENRRNIQHADIITNAGIYSTERFRLLYTNKSEAEKERIQNEVFTCWPFTPELLDLLEDHILLSSAAQETRDLIRILAQVFRSRGTVVPVITPADFFVDGESDEVQTLVDSIAVQAGQENLRQIAQRNLFAVRDSGSTVPHVRELVSSLWMRSISPGKSAGGTPAELHLDITRDACIDNNSFQAELALLIENSVNIHGDEVPGGPLWFGINENPRAKVRACAKNDRLWQCSAAQTSGTTLYPGQDMQWIRKYLRYELAGQDIRENVSRIIVLAQNWRDDPWSELEEADNPAKWDRPVLLVIPDNIESGEVNATLGPWLAKHVQKRRNTIRFLLPAVDMPGLYNDKELLYSARCSYLSSREGWGSDPVYFSLHQDFNRQFRTSLKSRYNRLALLRQWNFQQPQRCLFDLEKIAAQGGEIPSAVEAKILSDLFDKSEFRSFVLQRAKESDFMGSLLDDLIEPPPPNAGEAIPFLGETKINELVLELVAEGDIVLNVNGRWIRRRDEESSEQTALRYIQSCAFRTGQELRQIQLALPGAAGGGTVTAPNPPTVVQPMSNVNTPYLPSPPSAGGIVSGLDDQRAITQQIPRPPAKTFKSAEPATGINLSGCFESWGVSSGQSIETARIEFSGLTSQQIKQILQRIPSSFKATLDITWREGGDQS